MPFNPPVVNDGKKKSSRVMSGAALGINEQDPFQASFVYRKAGEAIAIGDFLTYDLTSPDLRKVLKAHTAAAQLQIFAGVAAEAATTAEASAGKSIKVQVAGLVADATIATGGGVGQWVYLSATAGRGATMDPAAVYPDQTFADVPAVQTFVNTVLKPAVRGVHDAVGFMLETAAGDKASMLILPTRF